MQRLLNLKSATTNNYHSTLTLKMKCTIAMQHTETARIFSRREHVFCTEQCLYKCLGVEEGVGGSAGIDRKP